MTIPAEYRADVALEFTQALAVYQGLHGFYGRWLGAVIGPAVDQGDAFCLAVQFQRPVQGGVTAAQDHQVFTGQPFRIPHAVVNVAVFPFLRTLGAQPARLECAEAGCQHDGGGVERSSGRGFQQETAVA